MFRGESEFGEKRAFASIPTRRSDDIDKGQHPSHEELGKGKNVGDIHTPPDFLFHEIRKPPNADRESKVINNEEDGRGNDQLGLATHKSLEIGVARDGIPVRRRGGSGGDGAVHERLLYLPGDCSVES